MLDALFVPDHFIGGRVRSAWPAQALREVGRHAVKCLGQGRHDTESKALQADVLVIHRARTSQLLEAIAWGRRMGARVIVQADDALWQFRGGHWQDHEVAALIMAARAADRMIVTTDYLAELYGRWCSDVRVVPNYLPAWVWEVEPRWSSFPEQRDGRRPGPVIGWRGDILGHRRDVEWIMPNLGDVCGTSLLRVVGTLRQDEREHALDGLPGYSQTGWISDPRRLYGEMASCDLALVPLDPAARFNEAKSWLAALEWMACGVPVVATATRDNRRLYDLTTAFELVSSPADMAAAAVNLAAILEANADRELSRKLTRASVIGLQLEARIDEWETALWG